MASGQTLLTPSPPDGLAVRRYKARACSCACAPSFSPRSPSLQPWQVVLFERGGQRWKMASTTASASGHGGEVAASNPALLTCTRSPRTQAACTRTTTAHASPRSLLRPPATAPHAGVKLSQLFWDGRPLSRGIHRHLRDHPRHGASRRSSTGLYGLVAAGTPACPRPRPALCMPVHLRCCERRPHSSMCVPPHTQDPPIPLSPASVRESPPQDRPENELKAREWRGTTSFTGPPPPARRRAGQPRLGRGDS